MTAQCIRRDSESERELCFDVELTPASAVAADPHLHFIRSRTTQRKPLSTTGLSAVQKAALAAAVGSGYRILWFDEPSQRRRMAKLLFNNAHIRLATPEAYEVHRKNIEWGARFSEDRLPEHALGVDILTRKIMRWALGSWQRVKFMNRFFAGTWLPRLQMDLLTGVRCAGHFVIVADHPLESVDDYIDGGRAMQRFWLEATRQNLQLQPEMTPMIFSRYVEQGVSFTALEAEQAIAQRLAAELSDVLDDRDRTAHRVYMGRVGFGPAPTSRSIRPPLEKLLVKAAQ